MFFGKFADDPSIDYVEGDNRLSPSDNRKCVENLCFFSVP